MKILVCDNLEEKVIEKLSELGEVTNISDSKTKTEELISNIVDTDIVVIRSSTKINKDILQKANKLKLLHDAELVLTTLILKKQQIKKFMLLIHRMQI